MAEFEALNHDSEEQLIGTLAILHSRKEDRDELISEYKRRSDQAFAPSTRRSRAVMMRVLERYFASQGLSATPPLSPVHVARMIDDLSPQYAMGTIECLLSAVTELHRANFLRTPRNHPIVKLAYMAARKNYGKPSKQAPPICRKDIIDAVSRMGTSRRHIRDKAVLLVAADSWCRSSELAALRMQDMVLQDDGSAILHIVRSKTDRFSVGGFAYLSREAVTAVQQWKELAKLTPPEPMFITSYDNGCRKPLLSVTYTQILRRATGRKDISSHSTRVGGVHDAMKIGCDMASIILSGRWKSAEMPARYGSQYLVGQSAAARVATAFRGESST